MSHINASYSVGAVNVFAPISHPVLTSIDPAAISNYLQDRERDDRQIKDVVELDDNKCQARIP